MTDENATLNNINRIVPSVVAALFVVCLLGLWATDRVGAHGLGNALYVAAIFLLGALEVLSFVAAAAVGLGYLKDYWSTGYPAMTLMLLVLWGIWRCEGLADIAIFVSGAILSFIVLLGMRRAARRIVPPLAVSSFVLAGLIPIHMAELIILSMAAGIFAGAVWLMSRRQLSKAEKVSV